MARKLYATAPDGSVVTTVTDNDYSHMVIADGPKGWHRVSAHGTLARAKQKVAASPSQGLLVVPVTTTPPAATSGRPVAAKPEAKGVTGAQAIMLVLEDGKQHKVDAVVSAAVELATGLRGKTPKATLHAMLTLLVKKGDVIRTGPATYKRAPKRRTAKA